MNIKTIIFGCIATGFVAGGFLLNKIQTTSEANYIPRTHTNQDEKSAADYINYLNSIKANQITGEIDLAEYNKVKQEVLSLSRSNNKAALGLSWANQGDRKSVV